MSSLRHALRPYKTLLTEAHYVDLRAPRSVDTAFFDRYVSDVIAHDAYYERQKNLEIFRDAPTKKLKPGVYSLDDFCNQF